MEAVGLPLGRSKIRGSALRLWDWGTGGFSIEGARTHSQFGQRQNSALPKNARGSTLAGGFDASQDVGAGYSIFLALAGMWEHRVGASELISRHLAHASAMGAEAGIDYDGHVRLLGGYSSITGSRVGGIERSVALSWGAAKTNKGFRLALDVSPQGFSNARSAQLGIELRHFALSPIDTVALGVRNGGVSSAALSLKLPF